jgi:deoxyribodipyrimidine photolyase-related protein
VRPTVLVEAQVGARLERGEVLQRRLQGETLVNGILVLNDQLTDSVGPVARAIAEGNTGVPIVLIEATDAWRRPRHIQALVAEVIATRGFALDLSKRGMNTQVIHCAAVADGLAAASTRFGVSRWVVMEPASPEEIEPLQSAATAIGIEIEMVINELWLTSRDEWQSYRRDRRELRMEHWYRRVRTARGWLMESKGDEAVPLGGRWNFDAENRRRLAKGVTVPNPPRFGDPRLVRAVADEVLAQAPEAFGEVDDFAWPTSRREALEALHAFCVDRLAEFGPYEDAMSRDHSNLFHSLLSSAINLGLLTPREVCERALAQWDSNPGAVPLQSIEGFIRQILGWREFMHHAYVDYRSTWRVANGMRHGEALPSMYWSGDTQMACIARIVRNVRATGYAHHIERLMVLGNFALLLEVEPQRVDAWFLEVFADAYPWVVTPNVIAMSQFADLGTITSKPYVAGGAYVSRMGDDCTSCRYDARQSSGPDACPLSTLYWSFVDRHEALLGESPRTATVARAWERRDAASKEKIRSRAEQVRRLAASGEL